MSVNSGVTQKIIIFKNMFYNSKFFLKYILMPAAIMVVVTFSYTRFEMFDLFMNLMTLKVSSWCGREYFIYIYEFCLYLIQYFFNVEINRK